MAISTLGLVDKCKRYLLRDSSRIDFDAIIQDALITACRDISALGGSIPLAWNREIYDEIFTRYSAEISAITADSPGVITADSQDPDLTSDHGFQTDDIVYLTRINGTNALHKLNDRFFRAVRIDATTLSLKTLYGTAVDTTNYETYSAGGVIYHAGVVLPTIEPSSGTASYNWKIRRLYDVQFDLNPAHPITEEEANAKMLHELGGRPCKWRYQQYSPAAFVGADLKHFLFWYGLVNQRFNVRISIEKMYPDIAVWDDATYPPHPGEIHDFIWHRALALLSTHSDYNKRRTASKDGVGDNTKIEIANAQFWISQAAVDEVKILDYSNKISGNQAYMSEGMSA